MKTLSHYQTLFLSTVIHLILAACLSRINFGLDIKAVTQEPIIMTFIEQEIIHYEKNANLNEYKRQDNSSISENIISNSSSTFGKRTDVIGNTTLQNHRLLLASLNELEDLVSQFNFRSQILPKDSSGTFSPVQGLAPDTESLSLALSNGLLKVKGFGRSKCSKKKRINIY